MIKLMCFCIMFFSAFAFSASENSCGENVEVFLERYQANEEFRKKHSSYPLRVSYVDNSAETEPKIVTISILNEDDKKGINIPGYPSASEIKSVPFEKTVTTQNGITVVTFTKPDTDYKFNFHFSRNKSCWQLVEVNDESL